MPAFIKRHWLASAFLLLLLVLLLPIVVLALSATARIGAIRTALSVMDAAAPHTEAGITNILLLGVGDEDHDGADLTDTMILASIDPLQTRSVVLLSLPRDLLLESETGFSQGRINGLYANEKYRLQHREKMSEEEASLAAMKEVGSVIGEKLGVPIHGIMKANFTAFVNIVDALGGVDVEVPERIVDYTYPLTEKTAGLFRIEAGPQHLDGETALRYARSRHSSTDFDRSARQQQLITALAAKVRGLGRFEQIGFLTTLYSDVSTHIETTLTQQELLGLAQIGSELSLERSIRMQVNFATGSDGVQAQAGGFVYPADPALYEGASVLLPVSLTGKRGDWSQLRLFASFLLHNRDVYLLHPSIRIIHAQPVRLQAWRLRNELLRYGFDVLPLESSGAVNTSPVPVSISYKDSMDESAAKFFADLLQAPLFTDAAQSGSGNILLTIDRNFRYRPFVELR